MQVRDGSDSTLTFPLKLRVMRLPAARLSCFSAEALSWLSETLHKGELGPWRHWLLTASK